MCSHGNYPSKVSTFIQDMDEQVHLLTDEKQKLETEQWNKEPEESQGTWISVCVHCVYVHVYLDVFIVLGKICLKGDL